MTNRIATSRILPNRIMIISMPGIKCLRSNLILKKTLRLRLHYLKITKEPHSSRDSPKWFCLKGSRIITTLDFRYMKSLVVFKEDYGNPSGNQGLDSSSPLYHHLYILPFFLVLNLQTWLLSPQYHIQFDNFFKTVRPSNGKPPTFS